MTYEEILNIAPYSLGKEEKTTLLTERLFELTELHRKNCPEYAKMLDSVGFDVEQAGSYKDIPFLPVRLFKELELRSVPDEEVVKTMTSSGTTGQAVSKIYLDRTTSSNQQKTMVKIVSEFTGSSRMPMIIIDCNLTVAMFFVLVGTGVFLLVYNSSKKGLFVQIRRAQSRAQASRNRSAKRYVSTPKTKKGKYQYSDRNLSTLMPIYWEVVTCFYFGFSFLTGSWAISWLIWIAAGAVKKVIENKYGEPTGA